MKSAGALLPPPERRKKLLLIALPIIGGMLSQNILNLVDIAMVSRLGDAALAATGVGSFANYLALAAVLGLASGVQAVAARRLGEGRGGETAIALNGGLLLALAIGVPLSALLISLAPAVMPLLNRDPAVLAAGTPYLQIRLLAIAAVGMNFAFRGYWSAVHLTRLYLTTLLIMHALNIFLNWVLIFGHLGAPALGVPGAAWATTISIHLGTLLYLSFAWRHARDSGFLRALPGRKDLGRQIRLSLPASGQQLFFSGGLLVLIWILGRVGTAEVAAANVLMTLGLVVILPAMGFGIAAASMVGNALGRHNADDAECWGWDATRLVFLINLVVAGLILVFAKPILSIFLQEPATLALAYHPLLLSAAIIAFDTAGMVLMNALHGAGATWRAMVISLIGQWAFFLPLAYIAGVTLGGGLLAVWIVQAVYRLGQAIVFAWTWRRRRWAAIEL